MDVNTAFVNAPLSEEIHITQPGEFKKRDYQDEVYKLNKALYGLKQASGAWNVYLHKFLMRMSRERSKADPRICAQGR